MARDRPVLSNRSSTAHNSDEQDRNEDELLDRRSYLKLSGTAATALTALGLGSNSASASVGTEPAAYLDSADDYNHVSFDGNWERWFTNTHGGYTSTTTDHSRDGNALRVTWPAGEYYGATMEYLMLQNHGYQPDAGHVRYWVYFPDDWQFDPAGLGGTKLPGFAGTYQTGDHDIGPGGYGGRPADGTNGWSARVFNCRPDRAGGQGPIALGSQLYHAGDGGQHGAHPKWNGALDTGTWHRIDQYVEMNTPGQDDGVYRSWIDGDLALEMEGLYFRDAGYGDLIGIQTLWAMFYFGGDWGSPVDQHMLFDDVELWLWRDRSNLSTDGSRTDEESEAEEDDDAEGEYEERFSYKSGADPTEYQIYVDGDIVQHVWGYATHNDDVEIDTVEIDGTEYQVVDAAIEADTWNGYHFNGEVVAISADHDPDELWITGQQISIDDYPDSPGDDAGDDSEDETRDDTDEDDERQDGGDTEETEENPETVDRDSEADDGDTGTDDEASEEDDGDTKTGDEDSEEDDGDTGTDDEDPETDDGDSREDSVPVRFERGRWRINHDDMSELFRRLFG